MGFKIIKADPCVYYCWTVYGLLIWLYFIDACLFVGQSDSVKKSRDKMKSLLDWDDLGNME